MADVPTPPQLPGVRFRPFRGPEDYPDLAHAITAAARGVGDDRVETAETLAASYDRLERCDRATDLLVAEADGRAVAFSRVWWDEESSGRRIYRQVCFIDPSHGGLGVGTELFRWNLERLREIASGHGACEQLLEVFADDRNVAARALFEAEGFAPAAYDAEMIRPTVDDLPDHPLPDGVELRPVTDDQLRTIWEADEEAFRDHFGYVPPTEGSYDRWLAFPYHDPTLWKVAWDEEGVAGQVQSFVDTAQNSELGLARRGRSSSPPRLAGAAAASRRR
jgi:GNAT superfamily N-acetyltransferase